MGILKGRAASGQNPADAIYRQTAGPYRRRTARDKSIGGDATAPEPAGFTYRMTLSATAATSATFRLTQAALGDYRHGAVGGF